MAISLLRVEKPLSIEGFVGRELATKVRYSTRRADSFRIDGSIAADADVFAHIALCEDRSNCEDVVEELISEAKQVTGLAESIQLCLRPYMHRGSINWLDPINAGPIFEPHTKPAEISPVVVLTSGGFSAPESQMDRVGRTVSHTVTVAEDVLKADGLNFRRVFSLCEELGDPITFTVWDSEENIAKFAYQSGQHLNRVKPQLDSEFHFDRTSFTRFSIERAEGEWEGVRL
ncbi:MAG: hypothetical protein ACI9BW_004069 [Gammaproteobacteria bacterium]|jgi:hypothetical protein